MPKREDYQPSGLKKAIAILAGGMQGFATGNGAAGAQLAKGAEEHAFNNAMSDWQAKTGAAEKLANSNVGQAKVGALYDRNDAMREGHKLRADTSTASLQARIDKANQEHQDRIAKLTTQGATDAQKLAATKEWHTNLGQILRENANTKSRAVDNKPNGQNTPVKPSDQAAAHKLAMQTVMTKHGIQKDDKGNFVMAKKGLFGTSMVPLDEATKASLNKELEAERNRILSLKRSDLSGAPPVNPLAVADPDEDDEESE
jgi:hypothetical protein